MNEFESCKNCEFVNLTPNQCELFCYTSDNQIITNQIIVFLNR